MSTAAESEPVEMYTIYHDPDDFPGMYVGRTFTITPGRAQPAAEPFAIAPTLEAVREAIPPGHERFDRQEGDDPKIVETWV